MIQRLFAERAAAIVSEDPGAIGLAAAGSWLSNELDEYSDLDLVLVTKHKLGGDKQRMIGMGAEIRHTIVRFYRRTCS